jgi:hypothetical protein
MFSHSYTRLSLPRSRTRMLVRMKDEPADVADVAYTSATTMWQLDKSSRRPIDGKTVLQARGGGRWVRC